MKFKVGDRVKIVRKVEYQDGWNDCWLEKMDSYVDDNLVYTILSLDYFGIKLKERDYYWPSDALELVEDKMIDLNKKYRTRCGYEVKLFEQIDNKIFGAFKTDVWNICTWSLDGTCASLSYQLVEDNPYEHIKIDDKVLVWNVGGVNEKCRGHYAGINSHGRPTIWYGGATSYTNTSSIRMPWDNCELIN